MGLFGSICRSIGSAVKSAASAVKETVSRAVDKVKEVGGKVINKVKEVAAPVREKVTGVWNKFTGKDKFLEAERLYEEITSKFNSKKSWFERESEKYCNSIERHIVSINAAKKIIKSELFVQMAENMEKIKDVTIDPSFKVEAFKLDSYAFDTVRSKRQLYLIDFNKHKFKTTIQAIFTLGFYTRKKAKETLIAVEEEKVKINAEIAKMDAEIAKLKAIDLSLENVERYFNELIDIYNKLLIRLVNNVNYLQLRCLAFAHKIVHQEMSIRRLPLAQIKEVEAVVTTSMILKNMVERQIVSVDDKNEVNDYQKTMDRHCVSIKDIYNAA